MGSRAYAVALFKPSAPNTKEKPPSLSSGAWCGRWDFPAGWPTVHWTVGPCTAVPSPCSSPQLRIPNKNPHGGVRHGDLCLVRKMGLEPTRHRHTHLKRACLPIPALPQIAFDCKKDSSTFGGIKSSPILYLFSCPIKQPRQPFLSFIIVIWARKPFAGAVFAPTHGDGGAFWAIVGEHSICSRKISRRHPFPRANNVRPYSPHMVVCRGRRPRRPGKISL